jgi:putative pyruvate formate lyase activating enzyme
VVWRVLAYNQTKLQEQFMAYQAAYRKLVESGELAHRIQRLRDDLQSCEICPRRCRVNRVKGELGSCRIGRRAVVSSAGPHYGEEDPLRGRRGSGTIFFAGCNLHCKYCQNASISQRAAGDPVEPPELAEIMLSLQDRGCHNINLVSPTHVAVQILEAVHLAAERGLTLPLVYNSGGYDKLSTLELLDGVVDIYMPDMKYADAETARKFSAVENYPRINRQAVLEMHRQVGDLQLSPEGIGQRGLLVRHLLLPESAAGTGQILKFIAEEVSRDTYLNLMDQYRPAYRADLYPVLRKRISRSELTAAVEKARTLGLHRLDGMIQTG